MEDLNMEDNYGGYKLVTGRHHFVPHRQSSGALGT